MCKLSALSFPFLVYFVWQQYSTTCRPGICTAAFGVIFSTFLKNDDVLMENVLGMNRKKIIFWKALVLCGQGLKVWTRPWEAASPSVVKKPKWHPGSVIAKQLSCSDSEVDALDPREGSLQSTQLPVAEYYGKQSLGAELDRPQWGGFFFLSFFHYAIIPTEPGNSSVST